MKKHQGGFIIIVILLVLLSIAATAFMSVKMGVVSSNMANSSSLQKMMKNEAETGMYYLREDGSVTVKKQPNQVFGFAGARQNKEVVFCYRDVRPAQFFSTSNVSVLYKAADGGINNSSESMNGYCVAPAYSTVKKMITTQISLKYTSIPAPAFTGNPTSTGMVMRAMVVSFVRGKKDNAEQINSCLNSYENMPDIDTNQNTVTSCLYGIGVQNYALTSTFLVS